jgi:hypothetical protein
MPNETRSDDALRRALANARLRDVAVASELKVDSKTVRRWLHGRLPQTRHRWALADFLGVDQFDLWPQLPGMSHVSPEMYATYPHRSSMPRETWLSLFQSASREIDILVYGGLFIAEDVELSRLLAEKAADGVSVQLLLGDPESEHVAERGNDERIADAMAAKIRNALVLFQPLDALDGVEIRQHRTVLYNSLYIADDDMLVNQHVYGVPAAFAPVMHLRRQAGESEVFQTYADSFYRVWHGSVPLRVPA